MQIVRSQAALHSAVPQLVGRAVTEAALNAAAAHPHAVATIGVAAAVAISFVVARRAAEFAPPHDQRLRQHAALFQVGNQPGDRLVQSDLAHSLELIADSGPDAFYRGEIARAIVDYCQKNGGFLSMEDFAAQRSDWVAPISTTYRGYTLHELPPNNQGLTALILLNILEGIDLRALQGDPVRYYHTLIEATKIAFADRNRYIADPAFGKIPVRELLSKEYATERRALINPEKAIDPPRYGDIRLGSDTTYFAVVDKDVEYVRLARLRP